MKSHYSYWFLKQTICFYYLINPVKYSSFPVLIEDKLHIIKLMPSLNKHKNAQSIISHARLFEDKHVQISSTLSVNITPQIPQPRQKISLKIK